jgi:hypothetical protein
MNKKILLLVLFQVSIFMAHVAAQRCPSPPPSCIENGDFDHPSGPLTGWYASHGTTSTNTANAPGAGPNSLYLWSFRGAGNGAFTCFNFEKNKTYKVCFWVRNISGNPSNHWGELRVHAANNIPLSGGSTTIPTVTNQLIDNSYMGPPLVEVLPDGTHPWKYVSVLYTPDADYNNLWLYALNTRGAAPPTGPQWAPEYRVQVDDIRVSEYTGNEISVTAEKDEINGCSDNAEITINKLPPTAHVEWIPSESIKAITYDTYHASPCSTTTYTIRITDSASSCPACLYEEFTYTISVNQMGDPSRITASQNVACGGTISMSYDPDPDNPCTAVDYTWKDPQGNVIGTGLSATVPNAGSEHSGTYTLEILTDKGCSEVFEFDIIVRGCCFANPGFTVSGCNPIQFTNTSTGNSRLVSSYWSFGDGSTSTDTDPTHTYATTMNTQYTVCLTALYEDTMSGENCCTRICRPVSVCPNPNTPPCNVSASWDYAPQRPGGTTSFLGSATGNGVICSYFWEFGDGTSMNTASFNTTHTYPGNGSYLACVTVTNCIYDAAGNLVTTCTNKSCHTVNIGNPLTGLDKNGLAEAGGVYAYPNPAINLLSIDVNGISDATVVIKNIGGAEIGKASKVRSNLYTFETAGLAPGMYFVEVTGSDRRQVVKFVKE